MKLPANYEAARRALAQVVRVDEAKKIRDQAKALQVYAAQAKDTELLEQCTDIRLRAERRAGELLREMAANGQRAVRKNMKSQKATSKLVDLGLTKSQRSRWQQLADLELGAFEARLARTKKLAVASIEGEREIIAAARAESLAAKRVRREERERELAGKILALPDQKFGVILEDYEWDFQVWNRETGMDRLAANHYPVSEDAHKADEIVERTKERFSVAADTAVLFMWVPIPHLAIGIHVLEKRGFCYRSNFSWEKDKLGMGYWCRERHEHLLIGVRGNIPCPAPGEQYDSILSECRQRNSEKPGAAYDVIEKYFPTLPKIELNRRGPPRPGWVEWGNEVEGEAAE